MKLTLTFYKESGKFYSKGEVTIPDDLLPFDENFVDVLLDNQKIVTNPRQFNIVVDELEGHVYPAFFKSLITIDHMKKAIKGNPHPPFPEATRMYDEVVPDKFKWDNLSIKEQEMMEDYITRVSFYGVYSEVFKHSTNLNDFIEFYDKVVVNYHNLKKQ